MIDNVANAVGKFEDYAKKMEVDEKLIESINADFIKLYAH